MKVAFCIKYVDGNPRFSDTLGNSDQFIIYDIENKKPHDKFTNHFKSSPISEIFCAQILIKWGVSSVVCGSCGVDAKNLFNEANIDVIENVSMKPTDYESILYRQFTTNRNIAV